MTNGGGKPPTKKKRIRKASRSYCSFPGCVKISQVGGVCCEHGARTSRSTCTIPGCSNSSQRGGLCRRHGSHRLKICTVEECPKVGRYCDIHSGVLNQTVPLPAAAAATPTPPGTAEEASPLLSTTSNVGFQPPSLLPLRPNPSTSGLKSTKSKVDKEFYTNLAQVIGFANNLHGRGFAPPPPTTTPSTNVAFSPPDGHSQSVRSTTHGPKSNPTVIVYDRAPSAQAVAHHHQEASQTTTVPPTRTRAINTTTTTLRELSEGEGQVVVERNNESYTNNDEFDSSRNIISNRRMAVAGSIPENRNSAWMIPVAIPATASHEHGYNTKNTSRLVQLAIPSIHADEINEENLRTARILHAARMAVIRAATNKVASRLSVTMGTPSTYYPPHRQADSPHVHIAPATTTGQLDNNSPSPSTTVPRCIPLFKL